MESSEGHAAVCHRKWTGESGHLAFRLMKSSGIGLDPAGQPAVTLLGRTMVVRSADYPFTAVLVVESTDGGADAFCTESQITGLMRTIVERVPGSPSLRPRGREACAGLLTSKDVVRLCGGEVRIQNTEYEGRAGVFCSRRGESGFAYSIEYGTASARSVIPSASVVQVSMTHGPWTIRVSNDSGHLRPPLCGQVQLDKVAALLAKRLAAAGVEVPAGT